MYCVAGKPETKVMVASSGGYGFLCSIADMVSNRKAGREFMSIAEGEMPLPPAVYEEAGKGGLRVAAAAERSRLLVFDIAEMKAMARGRGVIVMGLEKGETLRAISVFAGNALVVTGEGRGGKLKTVELAGAKLTHHVGHRARMGRVLPDSMTPVSIQAKTA
jgi:topoisomerase-4 subunit A